MGTTNTNDNINHEIINESNFKRHVIDSEFSEAQLQLRKYTPIKMDEHYESTNKLTGEEIINQIKETIFSNKSIFKSDEIYTFTEEYEHQIFRLGKASEYRYYIICSQETETIIQLIEDSINKPLKQVNITYSIQNNKTSEAQFSFQRGLNNYNYIDIHKYKIGSETIFKITITLYDE